MLHLRPHRSAYIMFGSDAREREFGSKMKLNWRFKIQNKKNCYKKIFLPIFFWCKFFLSNFFLRKFFFLQKYFCEDFFHNIFANFFCIWWLRNNVFCEIFIWNFAYCELFCFAILVQGKKKLWIFFAIFFSAMNVNTKFEIFYFLKKSKIFSDSTFGFLYWLWQVV